MYNINMEPTENKEIIRKAAINGLAVVGFVALIVAGLSLAVYSVRFVPTVVNSIGAAAVYLGSKFSPAPDLSVIPNEDGPSTIFLAKRVRFRQVHRKQPLPQTLRKKLQRVLEQKQAIHIK